MWEITVCQYSQICIYFYQNELDFMLVEVSRKEWKKIFFLESSRPSPCQ
jgi:hypothetical protein